MVADACEKLFRECYQNNWVTSGEQSTFVKNCRQDSPRVPANGPPASLFTLLSPTVLASEISAAGSASYSRCRGYAGDASGEPAVEREASWALTPLAWLTAATSAALFILGLRSFPPMGAPAGHGGYILPSYSQDGQLML